MSATAETFPLLIGTEKLALQSGTGVATYRRPESTAVRYFVGTQKLSLQSVTAETVALFSWALGNQAFQNVTDERKHDSFCTQKLSLQSVTALTSSAEFRLS